MNATRKRLTSRLCRSLVTLVAILGVTAVNVTNANPASADFGIPNWAKIGLPAAAAVVSTTVSATVGATEAVAVAAGSVASAGGAAVAAGGTSLVTAAELAGIEASYALPAAGTVAAGAGVCAGTFGIACVVGGAAALAVGGYALYKLYDGSGTPNGDIQEIPATTAGTNGAWQPGGFYGGPSNPSGRCATYPTGNSHTGVFCIQNEPAKNTTGAANLAVAFTDDGNNWYQIFPTGGTSGTLGPSPRSYSSTFSGNGYQGLCLMNGDGRFTACWNAGNTFTPATPATMPPPPTRELVTTRQCITTAGTISTVTGTGAPFIESAGVKAVAAYPNCPAGTSVKSTKTVIHTPSGIAPDKTVTEYIAPSSVANGVDPAPLVLYYALPDGSWESCESMPSPCADWFDSQTKEDTYQCRQGATVLALSECDGLRRRYMPPLPNNGDSTDCFDGMGLSPLTWPKGLIISPLKCLFIPSGDAMARWQTQVTDISQTGVIAVPITIGNFVTAVFTAGSNLYTCPTEQAGTYTDGHTTVSKAAPIHWCDVIANAGDETQNTAWGLIMFNGARIALFVYFGLLWYNRISATAGSQEAV